VVSASLVNAVYFDGLPGVTSIVVRGMARCAAGRFERTARDDHCIQSDGQNSMFVKPMPYVSVRRCPGAGSRVLAGQLARGGSDG
jgi:hypothetical protein